MNCEAVSSARAAVRESLPPAAARPRWRRTAAGLDRVAVLAMVAVLAIGHRARALDLTAGPVDMPPGGVTCQTDVDQDGSGLTLQCAISTPGAFVDLYYGLANNSAVNGYATDGTGPTGREIFRYSSSTANSIVYTSATTIDNIVTNAMENVNTRLVLTLTSGNGVVIDTGGNPANNGNGDIQKLFRIAGNTFSLRLAVTSNHLTIPDFGPSNSHVFNAIHHPPGVNSIIGVNTGFYYLQCTP
jgi:hypothetical protein